VDEAKQRLEAIGRPVPAADPAAVVRMMYESTHGESLGLFDKMMGAFHRRPNVTAAAGRTGPPTMTAQGPAQAGAFPNGFAPTASLSGSGTASPSPTPSQTIVFEPVAPAPAGSPTR
jgi:hypothetical protein